MRATPPAIPTSCGGVCIRPREITRVVAPAGGWKNGVPSSNIEVMPMASDTAIILVGVNPAWRVDGSPYSPKRKSIATATDAPKACPRTIESGLFWLFLGL